MLKQSLGLIGAPVGPYQATFRQDPSTREGTTGANSICGIAYDKTQ